MRTETDHDLPLVTLPPARLGPAPAPTTRRSLPALPLGLRWSVYIAALIVAAMGLLGFFLIQQQEAVHRQLADRFSQVIVEQLAGTSSEPLMAADALALQVLLQRHVQSPLVLGVTLFDAGGTRLVDAGVAAPDAAAVLASAQGRSSWDWEREGQKAVSYLSPVLFQDVTAGYLVVSIDRTPLEQDLRRTVRFLAVWAGFMILLGVLFSTLLAHRLSRPIKRLAEAGAALAESRPPPLARDRDEIGQVLATFEHLADANRRKVRAEAALSRYVSPEVARQLLADDLEPGPGGRQVNGSVLFCDIVGFTELSEQRQPAEVAELLNAYFGYFALAAQSCGGTVDNFIGDCIMVVFGVTGDDPHHALHALTCGMLIQEIAQHINRARRRARLPIVTLRAGASSGPMLAGNLGGAERMQFTVVGDTVNVAARLCAMADPGGVLLSASMLESGFPGATEHYASLGQAALRGRREQVDLCAMDVAAVAHDLNADRLIEQILSGTGR
jgi:adenylate cyclase